MKRDIHDIYDVIMKIIITSYGVIFLNFIGIDKNIKKVLKTEFVTLKGNKFYLDFLCLLEDDSLCHIEFQFPKAYPNDLDRFFDYNVVARIHYESITETIVINFTSKKGIEKSRKIGKSISFHPKYFYLGDVDYYSHWQNINIKSKSNVKLNGFEEIVLMITCLVPECKNKVKILDKISIMLKNRNLFDETKFDCIQSVIKLEIENLLSDDERKEISEDIDMTPEAKQIITQAIEEVNRKVLYETKAEAMAEGRKEGIKEGRKEGIKEGIKEGRKETLQEIARNLKDVMSDEEISRRTGLTVEEIKLL